MQLEGRVALVTGAARRLGREIALDLAAAGADIIVHVHTSSALELAAAIRRCGRRALILRADLSRVADVQQLTERALEFDGRVDVLVHNAALFYPIPIASLSTKQWRAFLDTNLTAAFCLGLSLGRAMRRQGAGKIIQLGDWSGLRPSPGLSGLLCFQGRHSRPECGPGQGPGARGAGQYGCARPGLAPRHVYGCRAGAPAS